jgi:single-stranded DNA-binding protein
MSKGIEIATWANVINDGEQKTSAAGNSYGVVVLSADSGNTDDAGKPIPAFMRVFAFGNLVSVAANLKRGGRAYVEGTLSVGIWTTNDGIAKLDLSVKAFRLEPTRIGKDRPPRDGPRADPQAPIDRQERRPEFDDSVPF